MVDVPKIYSSFTSLDGNHYDLVREIAFHKKELVQSLPILRNNTRNFTNMRINSGSKIYQSLCDNNVAYKIYNKHNKVVNDAQLIQELQSRKDQIKYAKFPTGVITLNDSIIGQEIPFFENLITLEKYSNSKNNLNNNPIVIYKKVLDILKDLYDAGILYYDIHFLNFLINKDGNEESIEIIDFDHDFISFDNYNEDNLRRFYDGIYSMFLVLNVYFGINKKVGKIYKVSSIDDFYEQLDHMNKKI